MHSAGGLVVAGRGAQIPDPAARIRPRRRRACDRAVRQACRRGQRDLVRHGRHHRQGLPGRGRPHRGRLDDGGGARASLQARLRPADQGAGHRHDRDRRGRRLDRRHRRSGAAARRPAFGRRRSGSGLLRPRRHRGDRDRRQPGARLLRSGLLPRRPHDARPQGRHDGGRQARRRDRPFGAWKPRTASTRSSPKAWRRRRASIWSRRARTRAPTRWSASAAPGRRMRRASRASSAFAR